MNVKKGVSSDLLAILVPVSLLFIFSFLRVFDSFELNTFDIRYKLRAPKSVSEDLVIIEIGDDSIQKIGQWPFPRNYHTLLTRALHDAGVRAILFDIFFSEPGPDDEEFARAVAEHGKVYFPYILDIDRDTPDHKMLYARGYTASKIEPLERSAAGTGFANVIPDIDGKIRRIPLFIGFDGQDLPLFTMEAALQSRGYTFDDVKISPGSNLKLPWGTKIPLDASSYMLINYAGKWGRNFRHYSYVDILQSYLADITGQEPFIDLNGLRDTVCFVGVTASASPDAHPSPLENMYPGVGVHANVYRSILSGEHIRRSGRLLNLAILFFLTLFTVFLARYKNKKISGICMFLLVVLYALFSYLVFILLGSWIDLFYPVLAILMVYLAVTVKNYLEESRRREVIEKELDIARDIQMSFLPGILPDTGKTDISVHMLTARQVGGDLYDIVDRGDGVYGIMVGDVSGKGVPAALYMAKTSSVFRACINEKDPAEIVRKMNLRLVNETTAGLFVTLTYMILDTVNRRVEFAVGGHLPTICVDPSGDIKFLDVEEGLPLGMMETDFDKGVFDYADGSIFVLYTDGVTEAMNIKGEMFGVERLADVCKTQRNKNARDIVEAIHSAVAEFAGKAEQHDDITVIAVRS